MKIYKYESDGSDHSSGWEMVQAMWSLLTGIFDGAAPVMERHGLHQKALILLALLDAADTPQELAHLLRTPPSTLSHLLRELEEKQFIERSLDARDRRKFRLRRTPSGDDALHDGMAAVNEAVNRQMAGFTPDEQATVRRAVALLLRPSSPPSTPP